MNMANTATTKTAQPLCYNKLGQGHFYVTLGILIYVKESLFYEVQHITVITK